MKESKWRLPRHKSWQPTVRKVTAGVVAGALLATGVGAFAADPTNPNGSGGGGSGSGGSGDAGKTSHVVWTYREDFGAPTRDNVYNAMRSHTSNLWIGAAGADDPARAVDEAVNEANGECQARTHTTCRLVGVGWVESPGSTHPSFTGAAGNHSENDWRNPWIQDIAPHTYNRNGKSYRTSTPFDDGVTSVDSLVLRETTAPQNTSVVVIVLGENEPPSTYNLSLTTQASGFSQAGYTGQVSDKITTRSNTTIRENVSGDSWLVWRGLDGTANRVKKQWTASNNDSTTVTVNKEDMSANWKYWPLGKYWFDTHAAKQGKMSADANHAGEHDASESWEVTQITPPVKTLTNTAGETVEGGSLPSGSLYTAHITARSEGSKHFWLYDTIDTTTARVVIGGSQQDDFNQITVTNSAGQKVNADISVDDSQAGKRIVKARVDNPTVDTYSLNVPQAFTPTGNDYTVRDASRACYNGDGQMCQDGDSREVDKVTPNPNKLWVLDTDS